MSRSQFTRRQFVQTSAAAAAAGAVVPYWFTNPARADQAGDLPLVGSIGVGGRWGQLYDDEGLKSLGNIVAVCDVDSRRAENAKQKVGGKAEIYDDYRKLLDRKDIGIVTIATPDHWHVKIAIDAVKAGKHVYCEKPLTLTIDEGKQICKVVKEHKQVFQVGTQQRSEFGGAFLKAVAMVHDGRIGKLQRITAVIGTGPVGGPFAPMPVPPHLNWDVWLGQTPVVPYTENRCHGNFRWWFEYSGGKLTDWGAHHIDIATWAMKRGDSGPISVEGLATFPGVKDGFNTATAFQIHCKYDDGVDLLIRNDGRNGITFEGDKGKFFVSRGHGEGFLSGPPVDELKDKPLPADAITKLYKGKTPTMQDGQHMANFFECTRSGDEPISDVFTHHRAVTTCHLANIAVRLGRKIEWDPAKEQIVGDPEANAMLSREQRAPYKIEA